MGWTQTMLPCPHLLLHALALLPAAGPLGAAAEPLAMGPAPGAAELVPGAHQAGQAPEAQRDLTREVEEFQAEYEGALDDWQQLLSSWPLGGDEPPHPVVEFFPRMQALGERGYAGADLWLLEHLDRARLSDERRRELRAALTRRLLDPSKATPRAELVLLELARCSGVLENQTANSLARQWLNSSSDPGVKAAAMWAMSEFVSEAGASARSEDWKEADELLEVLLDKYPDTAAAALAAPRRGELMQRRFEREMEAWFQSWTHAEEPPDPELHPSRAWWPRFEGLAQRGIGRALWWLVLHAEHQDLSDEDRRALRVDLMDRIIRDHSDEDWLVSAVRESGRMVDEFSRGAAVELGQRLLASSRNSEVLAHTLYHLAELAAQNEDDDESVARAIALLERLAAEHPTHHLGRSAAPQIYELRHLRIGQRAPEMEFPLPDGTSVRLSDYRGKVLVMVFWAYWSGTGEEQLTLLQGLDRSFTGEPFELLGLNLDLDIDTARSRTRAAGATFDNLWLGGPSHAWPQTWNVKQFPRVFVIDPIGRIRAKHSNLERIRDEVGELLEEDPPGPSASGDPAGDGAPPISPRRGRRTPRPPVEGG